MRALGALLVAAAGAVGAIAALWTVWRALGAEVDFCPRGGGCISAYLLTVPALLLALVAGYVGVRLLRRRDG